jgi:hypothetical protein
MMSMNKIIDAMLPGDDALELPPASQINFNEYLVCHDLALMAQNFLLLLDSVCMKKYSISFDDMDKSQYLEIFNACRLEDVQTFSMFVRHLLRSYYSAPIVLMRIGSGSSPPFPNGNTLNDTDWTILESVYERGSMYRNVL